jgi:Glycerophosphoryl diester phosphodiesterase family
MKLRLFTSLLAATGLLISLSACKEVAGPEPLTLVHAHNDYEHKRPLFDALDQGFCSVEADIHLVDGKLLVAHDRSAVDPARTLESLYLEPLRQRVKQNGGRVYRNGPEVTLLIDFKTAGEPTYAALRDVLKKYSDILTVFRDGKKETNAVTAILTGGYSRTALANDSVRYAAGDGTLPDLKSNPPANLVPWISENWSRQFKWRGTNAIPEKEQQKLKTIVGTAHQQGRRVRFWGSPDQPNFWKELLADGVDLINTDDLKGFQEFYHAQ